MGFCARISLIRRPLPADDENEEDALTRDSNAIIDLVHQGRVDETEKAAREFLERYPEVHDGYDRLAWSTRRAEIGRQRQTVTARSSSSSKPTRNSTNPPSPSHSSR